MPSSRLKLNPTKTEVLWIGSSQQLSQISVIDILLQSSTIRVGEFARDLGVIIDWVVAVSTRGGSLPYWFLPPTPTPPNAQITNIPYTRSSQNTYPGVHIQSPGLLQLTALWCVRQSYPKSLIRPERRCSATHWSPTTRPYLAGFVAVALVASSETRWLQTTMFCLLVFVWPPYLADDIRKSSTVATLFHRQVMCRFTHTQHIRRQELRCRRATCLKQSSGPLARRVHYIRQFQAWT